MIHMYCALIKCACKCEHCFEEKHDCVMNLVLCSLQLMMHHVVQVMIQHLIVHA